MATKIQKFAKAKRLGIDGYRSMSEADLDAAIAKAEKGSAPAAAKGKTPVAAKGKVSSSAAKGKTASTTAAKGKTAARKTTAPATKSTAQKSTPRASAAKGKASRQSPAKATTTKAPAKKTTPARKSAANTSARVIPLAKRARPKTVKTQGTRNTIDMSSIDWQAETTVGRSGKRSDVLKALKKFKGNYNKVFEALKDQAKVYYKGKTKAEAEHMLRWLIARVAYDFVMNTGQHNPGSRRAYGTAGTGKATTNGSASKTTATKRVAAAKKTTPAKATGARKTATTAKGKGKAAPAARKTTAGRTAARGKTAAKR